MSSKRIHICHVFATFAPGGPQVRVANIINRLPNEFRHSILAMDGNFTTMQRLREDVEANAIDIDHDLSGFKKSWYVAKILRELEANLLVTHNWGSMEALIARPIGARLPWIHMETGFEADEAHGFKKRRTYARRILFRRAHTVIVPSKELAQIATEQWHVPREKLSFINNGVDTSEFTPGTAQQLRCKLGIPKHATVIGTVSNLRPVKNPLKLLTAFNMLRNNKAHLVFVGDGDIREQMETCITNMQLQDRVHLVGNQKEVAIYHQMFDIFALSSLSEQSPVSVLEAMSCGTPIVSTDVGDVAKLVCVENGAFIVDPMSTTEFAVALQKLCDDGKARRSLGKLNRQRAVERFSLNTMIEHYESIYRQVAKQQN